MAKGPGPWAFVISILLSVRQDHESLIRKQVYYCRVKSLTTTNADVKSTITFLVVLLLAGVSIVNSDNARAGCVCVCVDGLNRPLCASAADPRPTCPPRFCPREPSTTRPLDQPTLPPTKARTCSREYIYNRFSGRYEWWQLCR